MSVKLTTVLPKLEFWCRTRKTAVWLMLLLCIFASCENDLAEIKRVFDDELTAQEVMREVQILYSDSAEVRVQIESPTLVSYLDQRELRQEFPDGIVVDFFGPGKQPTSTLSAKFGVRMERDRRVVVRDSVIWESRNGDRLETEELIWDEGSEKVFTNKFVTITRPEEIIYGYGFESNQDFTYSKIKAIEGVIKVDDLDLE